MVATQALQTTGTQPIRRVYSPRTDIYETDEALVVVADLPGVEEKGLDITLNENRLVIHGSSRAGDFEGYNLAYREYNDGDYERSFVLADEVDKEKIDAALKNGVLELRLPKVKEAAARQIAVKSG